MKYPIAGRRAHVGAPLHVRAALRAAALRPRYASGAFRPIAFMRAGGSSSSIGNGAIIMEAFIYFTGGLALFALCSAAVLAADRL